MTPRGQLSMARGNRDRVCLPLWGSAYQILQVLKLSRPDQLKQDLCTT